MSDSPLRIDLAGLRAATGDKVFRRGEDYCANGAVDVLEVDDERVVARVFGSEVYRTELSLKAGRFAGECSCPAFESMGPCKHLVAVALTVEGLTVAEIVPGGGRLSRLRERLVALGSEGLADLVLRLALRDPDVFDELEKAGEN